MKFILFFLAFCITFSKITKVFGEEWGNMHISYIREVNNQLYLSDFQLGSEESIKDNNGHGFSLGWLIKNEGGKFFLFNSGISNTDYHGTIEDGVNVSFKPQSGTGYESLSQSKNIFYEIDQSFTNTFISFSYTNWEITKHGLKYWNGTPIPSTYGIGLISQNVEGRTLIKGIDKTLIAEASYDSGLQRFYLIGWSFNFEFLQMSFILRYVTSPVLNIKNCNSEAVGELACSRIKSSTGNRNNSSQLFNGGVFSVGTLF